MIIKNVDLNSDRWCDLVFEGKNQEYGAYYLRKTSSKRHLLALSVVIAPMIVILSLFKFIHFNPAHSSPDYEVRLIELSDLMDIGENYRIGGDEFASLIVGVDEETIRKKLSLVSEKLSEEKIKNLNKLSLSYGLAAYDKTDSSLKDTFVRADNIMYQYKREFKERVK